MRASLLPLLLSGWGLALSAQTPAAPAASPTLKWRGSLWASAVTQDRETDRKSVV